MTTLQTLRAWLALTTGRRASPRHHTLALFAHREDVPIATWTREDIDATRSEDIHGEIEALCESRVDDGTSLRFHLRWLDSDGKVCVATTWVHGTAVDMDGSEESRARQNQAHLENLHKLTIGATGEAMRTLRDVIDQQRKLIELLQERVATAEAELVIAKAEREEEKGKQKLPRESSGLERVVESMLEGAALKMAADAGKDGEV